MFEVLIIVALASSAITFFACTIARAAGREAPKPVPHSVLLKKVF
jgi:hypothetical protein